MSKITPCLWFNGDAEEAANFYVSLVPDSEIEIDPAQPRRWPVTARRATCIVVEFTLAGQRFMALNGGMRVEYTHAVSFMIDCDDQAEVDRHLGRDPGHGGKAEEQCGWIRDRWGCPGRSCRTHDEISRRLRQGRRAARHAGDDGHGQARHRGPEARL